jgi:RimJ/RimL family protein N-acetyltransferase
MEHFPSLLSPGESDALVGRIRGHFDRYGFGLWVVEVPGLSSFAGFVGLGVPPFAAAFTPCVEIGWRLGAAHWGRGFATEAAAAAVTFAFESLALPGLVSFTSPRNARSMRVMRAIGMTHAPEEDFDHPRVAAGHPLSRHVLYRLSAVRWREATGRPAFGPSTRERAEAFASALDADEFERARPLVSPHCSYEVRGVSWHGPDAILGSYADATRSARTLVDEVRYQSRVSALTERALDVHFTDVLLHAGREHRHRCVQHLTFGPDGLVERIVHEDLPGERAALAAFLSGVGAG